MTTSLCQTISLSPNICSMTHPSLQTPRWWSAARPRPSRSGRSGTSPPPASGCPRSPAPRCPTSGSASSAWRTWPPFLSLPTPCTAQTGRISVYCPAFTAHYYPSIYSLVGVLWNFITCKRHFLCQNNQRANVTGFRHEVFGCYIFLAAVRSARVTNNFPPERPTCQLKCFDEGHWQHSYLFKSAF